MFEKICLICLNSFQAKVFNKICCSKDCFIKHRKNRSRRSFEKRKVVRFCKHCTKEYVRIHERSGFCSISCSSAWHYKNGTFDAWKNSSLGKRSGKIVYCSECQAEKYITNNQFNQKNFYCNKTCKGLHQRKIFKGYGNPMFGKKLSAAALNKQKMTLFQNHGVTNAYFLSKHRTTSKAQKEIFDFLSKNIADSDFEEEKYFLHGTYRFFIDIFSEAFKTVIEFNGDYWHCNPNLYSASFFHPKKRMFASEIWQNDLERMTILKENGYNTIVIWEKDYKNDKFLILENLKELFLTYSRGK